MLTARFAASLSRKSALLLCLLVLSSHAFAQGVTVSISPSVIVGSNGDDGTVGTITITVDNTVASLPGADPAICSMPSGATSHNFTANFTCIEVQEPTDVSYTAIDVINGGSSTAHVTVVPKNHNPPPPPPDPQPDPGDNPVPDMGSSCPACGKPINPMTGNVYVQQSDFSVPGLSGGVGITRTWNSLFENKSHLGFGWFGRGWMSNLDDVLINHGSTIEYYRADGKAITFAHDQLNNVWTLASPLDARAALTYDSFTQTYRVAFHDGSSTVFGPEGFGYVTAFVDRNGNTTRVNYDEDTGLLSSVVSPSGHTLTLTFGADFYISSVVLDGALTYHYHHDGNANVTAVDYPDGTHIYNEYDSNNLLVNVRDNEGKILESHTYDAYRRGNTSVRANGVELVTVHYPQAGASHLVNSAGDASDYGFSVVGGHHRVTATTGFGCSSCSLTGSNAMSYDANSRVTSSTDELGHTTGYVYDSDGNLISQSRSIGSQTQTTSYTYNSLGEVLTATDPLGKVTTNTYDTHGNLLTTTAPSPDGTAPGPQSSFTYDVKGQLLTVTDPLAHITTMTYTAAGQVATITDAQNNVTHYEYDARGNRTAVVDAATNRTEFTYDLMNRLTKVTQPDGTHSDFAYDSRGRRTSVTDANGNTTTYAYDDADRLVSVTDALQQVTSYAYDNESNLLSITDALGRVTHYTYDQKRRPTQTQFPSGLAESYTYDSIGNLLTKTDRNGNTTTFTYDPLDRVSRKQYQDATGVDYVYDLANRLTQVSDASGTYGMSYDNLGRLAGTTTQYSFLTGHTFTMAYTYDAASNRVTMTDPQGGSTSYAYDTLNRLGSLTDPQSHQFTFAYDNLSRRTGLNRANGVNTSYAYDPLSRLLSIGHEKAGLPTDGTSYSLDNVGNRLSKTIQPAAIDGLIPHTDGTTNYTYDSTYQLVDAFTPCTVMCPSPSGPGGPGYMCSIDGPCPPPATTGTDLSYQYDSVGNATTFDSSSTNAYNNSNQLTADASGNAYGYDNNGNRVSATQPCSGNYCGQLSLTTTYAWDLENRLSHVGKAFSGDTISFKYDPFGRRIQKTVTPGGVSFASSNTIYVYDGANIIEELDGSGSLVASYTQGAGVDEPLAMQRDGATYYYHADGLGSITSLTDSTGAVVNSYSYSPFGNGSGDSGILPIGLEGPGLIIGSAVTNPFQFTGREFDSETGLYYYRARYYDPSVGRFLSEDPVEFAGGLVNFYSYVGNRVTIGSDPSGMWSPAAHDALLRHALKPCGVSDEIIQELQADSRDWDENSQGAEMSNYHSMAYGNQTAQEAIDGRNKIIQDKLEEAKDFWTPHSRHLAIYSLAVGVHALMDMTSPAHVDANGNPIKWCGMSGCSGNRANVKMHSPNEHLGHETVVDITPEIYRMNDEAIRIAFAFMTGKTLNCSACGGR